MSGIYIHIPFCRQACTYCNFYFSTSLNQKSSFLDVLLQEISLQNDFIDRSEGIETIYFGGGTPSLLKEEELQIILETIHSHFRIEKKAEITLEANPDDIDKEKVKNWMRIGINRLSLGVQSFNEEELRWMNRAHSAEQAGRSIDMILEAGMENVSADLIFGSPLLTDDALIKNLSFITKKNIPHLSCYSLTVEPKTALQKMIEKKKSMPVDNEHQAKQFLLVMEHLAAEGYEQYEISNYAKQGFRSRHNSSYWKNKPYWGFGPSAHSFDGKNKRRWNVAHLPKYTEGLLSENLVYEEENLSDLQLLNEYIMTALRTIEGIDLDHISKHFGEDKKQAIEKNTERFIRLKEIEKVNEYIYLTPSGKLLSDYITAELFFVN
ncbi:MAG: radical SAM family heme chaperone HemW [Ferruginibacter sp.]|nr:radical SAM family heme chaperone HemW [Ferruginibacter sp.]